MKSVSYILLFSITVLALAGHSLLNAEITELGKVEFRGEIFEDKDISAIVYLGKFIVIGADEKAKIQVLERKEESLVFQAQEEPIPLLDSEKEIDIEGITQEGDTFYVVGSHSLKRKKVDPDKRYKKNLERMTVVESEDSRFKIFRLTLDPDTGMPNSTIDEKISIKENLEQKNSILHRFTNIPSKENGVDIEGIAIRDGSLYLGFRGPVLRENYVPVMVFEPDNPEDYELRYVDLGGQGIRDITQLGDGFLIIGGPVGDGAGSYNLYYWDGTDGIPGEEHKKGEVNDLGQIPTPEGGKPEGVTVMEDGDDCYKVIIVYDGVKGGEPTLFRVCKH